jgi:hypothetical protein
MHRARRRKLLPVVGMLCLMLLGLAGCSDKGGEQGDTPRSTSRLNLQIRTANPSSSGSVPQTGATDAVHRVVPGDRLFVTRLVVSISAVDIVTITDNG